MKKVLSLMLVCVMLLTLAACGKDEPQTTDPSVAPSQAATGNTEKPAGNPEKETTSTQKPDKTPSEPTDNPSAPTETPDESPDAPTDTPNDTPVDTPAQPDEDKPTPCSHSWNAATCTKAKTCSKCGATEGSTAAHDWKDATYTAPKTCSVCGATEGETLPLTWTFTDGGDHIVATSQAGTKNIPLDTSHLPKNYETETEKQTVEVYRSKFSYVHGWIVYDEFYTVTHSNKDGYNAGSSIGQVGLVMVKMDGTKQKILKDISAIAGYIDGYIYYIKLDGLAVMGEPETHKLYKRTLSENGDFGEEIFVADLDGIDNEYFYTAWMEDGWILYSCCYGFSDDYETEVIYKIRPDGTQCQKHKTNNIPYT